MSTQTNTAPAPSSHDRYLKIEALKRRCLLPGDGSQAALTAVSRAEQALDKLSVNFDDWMGIEVDKLRAARANSLASGLTGAALDELFSVSHDLKGQAGTLGYPFAADICASLCRLIDIAGGDSKVPAILVEQHVDGVNAIFREGAKGHDHPKASILVRKLADVTDDYLTQLSRVRQKKAERQKV